MKPLDADERPLLEAVLADPDDDALRLAYADWLEERGDERAEYLRAEIAFHRVDVTRDDDLQSAYDRLAKARDVVGDDWVSNVARLRIENCKEGFVLAYDFVCHRSWQELEPTEEAGVRHCGACGRDVFYCQSLEEARRFGSIGDCVAIDASAERYEGDMTPRDRHRVGSIQVVPRIVHPRGE